MSADLQFKQLVDRILRCREAEDAAKEDTKEVYSELKGMGFDKTAAGALVNELRKREKNPDNFEEASTILDLYRDAYQRASGTPLATHTHENLPQHAPNSSSVAVAPAPAASATETTEAAPLPASVTNSDDVPAFIKKERAPLRPHCLNPSLCAGSGRDHCHACRKAMAGRADGGADITMTHQNIAVSA